MFNPSCHPQLYLIRSNGYFFLNHVFKSEMKINAFGCTDAPSFGRFGNYELHTNNKGYNMLQSLHIPRLLLPMNLKSSLCEFMVSVLSKKCVYIVHTFHVNYLC